MVNFTSAEFCKSDPFYFFKLVMILGFGKDIKSYVNWLAKNTILYFLWFSYLFSVIWFHFFFMHNHAVLLYLPNAWVVSACMYQIQKADQMVEEFMLAANVWFSFRGDP